MYIIVGLGNPDRKYQGTRHNIGFDVVDAFAKRFSIDVINKKFNALVGTGVAEGHKVVLVKPQTYMNLSGESVGRLRIRKKGSAGGHNGLKNIILHLGHGNFHRIKVGVGEKPTGYDLADYVLGHFSKEEQKVMEETAKRAVEALLVMMNEGADAAMNQFN